MPTLNYTAPVSCVSNVGQLNLFNGGFNLASATLFPSSQSCSIGGGSSCNTPNIPYGSYTVEILTNCSPLISNVTVNGQSQNGNGTLYFNVITDNLTPNIDCFINCS